MDRDYINDETAWLDLTRAEPLLVMAEALPEPPLAAPWRPRRRIWLPAALFAVTCLSTLWAGVIFGDNSGGLARELWYGLAYSAAVMTILLCHEMGHFLQAHRYGVYASLPYFIPMPFSPIGTFGAVIAMEPRKGDRRAMFDIGISGPLAGLVPAFIFSALGLMWSTPCATPPEFGSSLLFTAMGNLFAHVPPGSHAHFLQWHPFAFAGWVGMLITAINLLPIGQLDGGHILYALVPKQARWIAALVLLAAVISAVRLGYWWWYMMLFLLMMLGTRHPPTADDAAPLGWQRYALGWLTLAFVPLGFVPIPFPITP